MGCVPRLVRRRLRAAVAPWKHSFGLPRSKLLYAILCLEGPAPATSECLVLKPRYMQCALTCARRLGCGLIDALPCAAICAPIGAALRPRDCKNPGTPGRYHFQRV